MGYGLDRSGRVPSRKAARAETEKQILDAFEHPVAGRLGHLRQSHRVMRYHAG
jgi:hypothetical protein